MDPGDLPDNTELPIPRTSTVSDIDEKEVSSTPRRVESKSTSLISTQEKRMAGDDDSLKIAKFNGKASDDYNTWRLRAVIALKGKGFWTDLQKGKTCSRETKDKAAALLVHALGDSALRVCSAHIDEPLSMLSLLDTRYASNRASNRVSILTSLYSKRFTGKENMSKYVDEFEVLFNQLERMGEKVAIPETHKAPLLLASLGHGSALESTVAALRLQDTDSLSWESVTADLIQEWKQLNIGKSKPKSESKSNLAGGYGKLRKQKLKSDKYNANSAVKPSNEKSDIICEFCGKSGHVAADCFINPDSEKCKLPSKVISHWKAHAASSSKSNGRNKVKRLHFGSSGIYMKSRSPS